jgi:hypothetical protein
LRACASARTRVLACARACGCLCVRAPARSRPRPAGLDLPPRARPAGRLRRGRGRGRCRRCRGGGVPRHAVLHLRRGGARLRLLGPQRRPPPPLRLADAGRGPSGAGVGPGTRSRSRPGAEAGPAGRGGRLAAPTAGAGAREEVSRDGWRTYPESGSSAKRIRYTGRYPRRITEFIPRISNLPSLILTYPQIASRVLPSNKLSI